MLGRLKTIGVILALIIAAILFEWGIGWVAAWGKRGDGEAFFRAISDGNYEAAIAQMTPELAQEWPVDQLQSHFGDMEPFTSLSLDLVGKKKRSNSVNITGGAYTASDCYSVISVSFANAWFGYFGGDGIEQFEIDPVCR